MKARSNKRKECYDQKKMLKRAATPMASQKLVDTEEAVLARGGGV